LLFGQFPHIANSNINWSVISVASSITIAQQLNAIFWLIWVLRMLQKTSAAPQFLPAERVKRVSACVGYYVISLVGV